MIAEEMTHLLFLAVDEPQTLTAAGWTVMILSVGSVSSLVTFCLYRVLRLPPVEVEEDLKGPPQMDAEDRDQSN